MSTCAPAGNSRAAGDLGTRSLRHAAGLRVGGSTPASSATSLDGTPDYVNWQPRRGPALRRRAPAPPFASHRRARRPRVDRARRPAASPPATASRSMRPLGLEGPERLHVVPHDPGQRQVGRRRDQVGRGRPASRRRSDTITDWCQGTWPGVTRTRDAGQDLAVALEQPELPGLVHRLEVVREVARPGPLVGVRRELELAALHHVGGVGERQPDLARRRRAASLPWCCRRHDRNAGGC